jgi:tetratricopeptide (TPR) repeat protein
VSLLLEALKKAERAKEEAQRRARGESADSADGQERKPVLTRDNLPDISPSLEIESADLLEPAPAPRAPASLDYDRPAASPPPAASPSPAPAPRPAPSRSAARATAPRPANEEAPRATAKKVFEAKFREPNPRMPFYLAMGALGVFAVGTVIYFWIQLRPAPALVNVNPPPQGEATVAATDVKPAAAAPVQAAPQSALAGLPTAAAPTVAPPAPAVAPRQPEPRNESRSEPQGQRIAPSASTPRATARATAPERERIATPSRPSAPQVNPKVDSGYSAYLTGDLAAARADYQQALRDEPGNRDALLGLAALEVRGGRYEPAEALYLRALQIDPRDSQAQAALISLRSARADPLATESRVKTLLAADPGAHALNFALGNQFAQQNRWAEAQQEYFKAYAAEPDNPDFAYNLAVSLDHLRQPKNALEYYQRAIVLAEKRGGASFDVQSARARADQLAR